MHMVLRFNLQSSASQIDLFVYLFIGLSHICFQK